MTDPDSPPPSAPCPSSAGSVSGGGAEPLVRVVDLAVHFPVRGGFGG